MICLTCTERYERPMEPHMFCSYLEHTLVPEEALKLTGLTSEDTELLAAIERGPQVVEDSRQIVASSP